MWRKQRDAVRDPIRWTLGAVPGRLRDQRSYKLVPTPMDLPLPLSAAALPVCSSTCTLATGIAFKPPPLFFCCCIPAWTWHPALVWRMNGMRSINGTRIFYARISIIKITARG